MVHILIFDTSYFPILINYYSYVVHMFYYSDFVSIILITVLFFYAVILLYYSAIITLLYDYVYSNILDI